VQRAPEFMYVWPAGAPAAQLAYSSNRFQGAHAQLSMFGKLDTHAPFLQALYTEGREQQVRRLDENFQYLGVRSSFSLANFLH
jgi:hypothetical protein